MKQTQRHRLPHPSQAGMQTMKIRELIEKTGVPKQTIHYYVRSGLLPKPRKLGPNSAEYSTVHVERIQLIKQLQENFFLPLSVIKKVLKKYKRGVDSQALLKIKTGYFRPLDQLLAGRVRGEDTFLRATGLRPERLAQYETWGIITPEYIEGQKVYSYDDQVIGKAIAQFREIGMTDEKGFQPDILKSLVESFRVLVQAGADDFYRMADRSMSLDETIDVGRLAREVMATFYYHLYYKLSREIMGEHLARLTTRPAGQAVPPAGEDERD
ncbi:MAG: MerR family transcriptional regulator [Proteobacteria bacterium]|nr:MerR family transcriptional regulator [Pseudomonadota bacterium]